MAHWIIDKMKNYDRNIYICSECGSRWDDYNYAVNTWKVCHECRSIINKPPVYEEKKNSSIDGVTRAMQKIALAAKTSGDAIKDMSENIHKLEQVSGKSIEELIGLFAAGWTLVSPESAGTLEKLEEMAEKYWGDW